MAKFGRAGNGPVPAREPGALDRLKALEGFREEILRAVRQTFKAVEQRLQNLEEVNEALVTMVGRPAVEEMVKKLHIERVEANAAKEEVAFQKAIDEKKVLPSEIVGPMSVVIGSETSKEGEQLYPTRVQLLFAALIPEYQAKLKDAKVGDEVETPFGSKFKISAIWDIDPNAASAQQAPAEALTVSTPQVEAAPLSPEAEEALVEGLASAAEQIESEKAQTEENLVNELSETLSS